MALNRPRRVSGLSGTTPSAAAMCRRLSAAETRAVELCYRYNTSLCVLAAAVVAIALLLLGAALANVYAHVRFVPAGGEWQNVHVSGRLICCEPDERDGKQLTQQQTRKEQQPQSGPSRRQSERVRSHMDWSMLSLFFTHWPADTNRSAGERLRKQSKAALVTVSPAPSCRPVPYTTVVLYDYNWLTSNYLLNYTVSNVDGRFELIGRMHSTTRLEPFLQINHRCALSPKLVDQYDVPPVAAVMRQGAYALPADWAARDDAYDFGALDLSARAWWRDIHFVRFMGFS